MKKIIVITFILSLLSSCSNIPDNSNTFKEKIKSGMTNFKNSINNPLKKN